MSSCNRPVSFRGGDADEGWGGGGGGGGEGEERGGGGEVAVMSPC